MKRLLIIFIVAFIAVVITYSIQIPRTCGRNSGKNQYVASESPLLPGQRISYDCQGKIDRVTGVILHYTDTDSFDEAISYMEAHDLFVQIMIDRDGKAYQLTDHLEDFSAGAQGANSWAINIEIVGKENNLEKSALANDQQFQTVQRVIHYLAKKYDIPLTNEISDQNAPIWHGIFSHQQIDQLHPRGGRRNKKDPGELYMQRVTAALKET